MARPMSHTKLNMSNKTMDFKKNMAKSALLGLSVALLSIFAYGTNFSIISVNFIYIFILSLVTTNTVDLVYHLIQKRQELKQMKKEVK